MTVALAISLIIVMLTGVAAVLVPAYLRQRVVWKKTRSGYLYDVVGEPFSEAVLDRCINEAFICLRESSDVLPSTLVQAASLLHVAVQKVETWDSPQHGGAIAGLTSGTTVYVGRDLASLCHEVAHVCEFVEGGRGKQDDAHETWARRGFLRAIDRYEVWRADFFAKMRAP